MSYGSDGPALFRRTASFVHKILAGEKPANIPVEQATSGIKIRLAEIILKAASDGQTSYDVLFAAASSQIQNGPSLFT